MKKLLFSALLAAGLASGAQATEHVVLSFDLLNNSRITPVTIWHSPQTDFDDQITFQSAPAGEAMRVLIGPMGLLDDIRVDSATLNGVALHESFGISTGWAWTTAPDYSLWDTTGGVEGQQFVLKIHGKNSGDFLDPLPIQAMLVPVPEPATYGLALAGLGVVGALMRRQRKSRQAA